MKQVWLIPLCVLLGAAKLHAGPKEEAIVVVMRLADQPSYAWTSTVSDDARTYEIDGKTSRAGYSLVKMPVINSVRRKLGRDVSDTRIELIFRGNVDCVLRTETGWARPDELPEPEAISDFDRLGAQARSTPTLPPPPATILKGSVIRRPTVPGSPAAEETRGYSNLQLAISPPHEELAVIIGSHKDLIVDGDLVTGTLTDLGAQLLLVRDGQSDITPLRAAGTFKIWLRGGMVARYQVSLEGTLNVSTPKSGRVTLNVHQRTLTELSEIGTAKVDVPELARAKLAGR